MERLAYSTKSDVFAFGVLLFEIFERCLPWQDHSNLKVAALVMSGKRLQFHTNTAADKSAQQVQSQIAELASSCWKEEPTERPAMLDVSATLAALKTSF